MKNEKGMARQAMKDVIVGMLLKSIKFYVLLQSEAYKAHYQRDF